LHVDTRIDRAVDTAVADQQAKKQEKEKALVAILANMEQRLPRRLAP